MELSNIPLRISCSSCGQRLIEAHVALEHDGTAQADALIIDEIAVVCPACMSHIQQASDDLTRALEELRGLEW